MKYLLGLIKLIITLFSCWIIGVHAEVADKDKPLHFEANTAAYDDTKQVYQLSGNVVMNKGTIIIKTTKADIQTSPDGYQYAIAMGGANGLAYIRQKREGLEEFFEGYGNKLEYNSKLDIIKITGNAKILRLDSKNNIIDEIKAPQMLYNGRHETYQAIGDSSNNGRVKAIISSKNNIASNTEASSKNLQK